MILWPEIELLKINFWVARSRENPGGKPRPIGSGGGRSLIKSCVLCTAGCAGCGRVGWRPILSNPICAGRRRRAFCSLPAVFLAGFQRAEKPWPTAVHRAVSSKQQQKKCQRLASSPLPETCGARPPNPRARLKAAVGLGLLRRFPLPPRRVGLCQPRDRWGPRARLWSQGEKRSGSPRAVHFPEPWDLHPGLGSDKCSLLGRGSGAGEGSGWCSRFVHLEGRLCTRPFPFIVSGGPVLAKRRIGPRGERIAEEHVRAPPKLAQMNGL